MMPASAPGPAGYDGFLIGADARTLGDSVTHRLRQAIVRSELPPGLPLGQEDLARTFGVSSVPIRESFQQLASEGLVDLATHRGAVVAQLSLEELDELYGIIWSLETLCVEHAVPHLVDAEAAHMEALVDDMERESRPSEWYALNVAYHRLILVAAGWSCCVCIVDECRCNVGRYGSSPSSSRRRSRRGVHAIVSSSRPVAAAMLPLPSRRSASCKRLSTGRIREHLEADLRRRSAR